jgi:hypothetical protein
MTSQRDETTPRPAGEGVADDPIIIERHDEILIGDEPALVADGQGYGPAAGDELVGRSAAPDTGGMDPAPLVVPAESAAAPGPGTPETAAPDSVPAGTSAAETDAADTGAAETGGPAPFGPESADPAGPGSPGTSSAPAALDEPGLDEPGLDEPGLDEPGLDEPGPGRAGVDEPGVLETPEPAVAGPAAAATGAGIPAAALSEQQWPAIQAMFVDDPKGSVQRAAGAADEVVKAFVASIEREQVALRAAWENDASTEDLRTALQRYRAFCGRLEGLA